MIKNKYSKKYFLIKDFSENKVVLLILFIIAWLYFYFQTSFVVLRIDDTIILPERAMFSNKIDWLLHLLFFNQTRFTFAGDFTLVRPLLFLSNFIFYEFIMSFNKLHTAMFLASSNAIGFILTFYSLSILTKNIKFPLVFLIATFSIVNTDVGYELFGWQHISAYWLGFGLFSLGASLSIKNKNISLKSISIFILSSLSNDCFLASTLIFLLFFIF